MEWYTFRDKYGFKHTTSSLHYPQYNAFINIHTIKSALYKANDSQIPVPQAHMKLQQMPIGPNLPGLMEIFHNQLAGPHLSSQWYPVAINLQKICEALMSHQQQQKKAYDSRKNTKTLSDLQIGQDILYMTTQDDWLSGKVTQISLEPKGYIVIGATYWCNLWC